MRPPSPSPLPSPLATAQLHCSRIMQAEQARSKAQRRQVRLAHAQRTGRSAAMSALQRVWLHGTNFLADHSRSALILALFGFKALEWWYTSAEERLAAGQALPPPPPPKAPLPDPAGCGLPSDPGQCPLCRCAPRLAGCSTACAPSA